MRAMARVKMNSITSSQPAATGPAVNNTRALRIRKPTIVALYQRGECPRKLCANAWASEPDIGCSLYSEARKLPDVTGKFKVLLDISRILWTEVSRNEGADDESPPSHDSAGLHC
ncbi:hypothetical protein EMIT0215P_30397 [Pseudomonas serboccidentalis]